MRRCDEFGQVRLRPCDSSGRVLDALSQPRLIVLELESQGCQVCLDAKRVLPRLPARLDAEGDENTEKNRCAFDQRDAPSNLLAQCCPPVVKARGRPARVRRIMGAGRTESKPATPDPWPVLRSPTARGAERRIAPARGADQFPSGSHGPTGGGDDPTVPLRAPRSSGPTGKRQRRDRHVTAPTIAERYTVTGEPGRGGTAVVHRARDNRHGRDVALKVMLPGDRARSEPRCRELLDRVGLSVRAC